jgi:hypothetical protein
MIIVCHETRIMTHDTDPQTPRLRWAYEIEGAGITGVRAAELHRVTFFSTKGGTLVVYAEDAPTAILGALSAVLFGVVPVDPSLAAQAIEWIADHERATLAALGPLN